MQKGDRIMNTIIPAQPGFFVVYPDGKKIPIIAWEISDIYDVLPITPNGPRKAGGEVAYSSNPEAVVRKVQS